MELSKVAAIAINNAMNYENIVWEAITDPATGLLNKAAIDASGREAVKKAKKSKQPLSIIFMDLDGLKRFNDTYGYTAGDGAIKLLASTIRENIFSRDIAGKWKEGDEFVVILPGINIETAQTVAEKIRANLERQHVREAPNDKCTVSIGVSAISENFVSWGALLKSAEIAKNQAKAEGKNRVCTVVV